MPVSTATFVSPNIDELGDGPLVVVVVFRQRRPDLIEAGSFLVDTGCLGIKDAWLTHLDSSEKEDFLSKMFPEGRIEKSGAWGRKFVEEALAFAKELGFKPHAGYKKAARVFGGIQSHDCNENFNFGWGEENKPVYFQDSSDSLDKANRIVRHLMRRCGEDGFDFVSESESIEDEIDGYLEMAEEGHVSRAKAGIMNILEKHPKVAYAHFATGIIMALEEKFESALGFFDSAVELEPDLGIAWYNKGITHQRLLQIPAMLIALKKAVAAGTSEDEYMDEAQGVIDRLAISVREDMGIDLDTFIEAGLIFDEASKSMEEEKWEAGRQGMEAVIRLNPLSFQAHNNMGYCLLKLNRWAEARKAFLKAIEINPDYVHAKQNLAALEKYID